MVSICPIIAPLGNFVFLSYHFHIFYICLRCSIRYGTKGFTLQKFWNNPFDLSLPCSKIGQVSCSNRYSYAFEAFILNLSIISYKVAIYLVILLIGGFSVSYNAIDFNGHSTTLIDTDGALLSHTVYFLPY